MKERKFELVTDYKPSGDQPEAISKLTDGINKGYREQTLLGVTGSGKTFTMANVIANVNKPTLVLAHNKILAAQLCSEFKEFFPNNAVEYFVSYYDYYQPEAYIPGTDTYIEKDSSVNDEIDKMRHSATTALSERNDVNFVRNKFRVRGDVVEIFPASSNEKAIRVEFFGDEIDRITEINVLTGEVLSILKHAAIFPASHYIVSGAKMSDAIKEIDRELAERIEYFQSENKLIEAQRIAQRTHYDMEMLQEIGFCSGIENYSRILSGRPPGSTPMTLLDHFPKDFLMLIDESHVTIPQVGGMYAGDRARKNTLVEFGFRLPSAFDNRPLNFDEFYDHVNQVIFVSATPNKFEREKSQQIVEQVIRPTGLVDPEIIVKPVQGQIEDLLSEINKRTEINERVLITTLTKKMAEDLTSFLDDAGVRVRYLHHDIDTIERMEIIKDLREGEFDVLVGINLLREGLDIPEVSLVAILDADKEGFLRSETSLVQTIGRAARNAKGQVIMYADSVTNSMEKAITETERRRSIQMAYNEKHGIVPKTIKKEIRKVLEISSKETVEKTTGKKLSKAEKAELISKLKVEMKEAAKMLEFEHAAYLRDKIKELEGNK